MSRSKHAVELCALLIDETYGELTSRIFTILLRRGRLPIPLLSKHTRLSPHKLRHGLAVLVQENLVYHNFDEDTNTTHYEANSEAAYMLVRSGKIVEIVESRYGALGADVMGKLFLIGHGTVKELVSGYESRLAAAEEAKETKDRHLANGVNGQSKSRPNLVGQMHGMLTELLEAGLIQPLLVNMFRSPTDTYHKIEKDILRTDYGGSTKGIKQKEELKVKIQARLQALRSEREWKPKGKKRTLNGNHANGLNGTNKRRRLSGGGGAVNGDHYFEDDGKRLDPNLVVRINYEKCTVVLRNNRLAALASSRIGSTTAQVYETGLRLIEDKIPRCRLDPKIDDVNDLPDGPTFTTMELTAALSKSVRPGSGIGSVSSDKVDTRKLEKARKSRTQNNEAEVEGGASSDEDESMDDIPTANGHRNVPEVDQDSDSHGDPFENDMPAKPSKRAKVTFQDKLPKPEASENRENRMLQVKNHLLLLAADDCGFLRKCGTRGLGEWTVDFEVMTQYLQDTEMDTVLLENFGKVGHRLARMMRKLGKLDEKQLPNLALVKQKDVRTKLAEMQMAGVVDIQEVPRDNSRTTSRTIFLWYFDVERVSTIFLDNIYKNMSRCFQRLDVERRRVQDVLILTQRSDVADIKPEEYLDAAQLNVLQQIEEKEESLLGHIGRLDELVGIFRDY